MTINSYAIWRGIHVLAVLLWIGGVAFVTTVLIPSLRKSGGDYQTFEKLEHRFGNQAKITTQLAFISGIAMLAETQSWERLLSTWWLWLMVLTWAIFTLILFVLEPFVIHKFLHDKAQTEPMQTLVLLQRLHYFLLGLGLTTLVAGAVGSHGGFYF